MKTTFNFKSTPLAAALVAVAAAAGCGADDAADLDDAQPVIDGYAANVYAAYGAAARRGAYLKPVAELLVDDLRTVRDANGRSRTRIIDPDVDLARQRDGLLPKPWILPLENNR